MQRLLEGENWRKDTASSGCGVGLSPAAAQLCTHLEDNLPKVIYMVDIDLIDIQNIYSIY